MRSDVSGAASGAGELAAVNATRGTRIPLLVLLISRMALASAVAPVVLMATLCATAPKEINAATNAKAIALNDLFMINRLVDKEID